MSRTSWPRSDSRRRSWHRYAQRDCARSSPKSKGPQRSPGWTGPADMEQHLGLPPGQPRRLAALRDGRWPAASSTASTRSPSSRPPPLRRVVAGPRRPCPALRGRVAAPLRRSSFRPRRGSGRERKGRYRADRSGNPIRPGVRDRYRTSRTAFSPPTRARFLPVRYGCICTARVQRRSMRRFSHARLDTPIRPRS